MGQEHVQLAESHRVIWHNADPEFYVEGSGLVHLGSADWVAVVPVIPRHSRPLFARRAELSRTQILRSRDGGCTWTKVSELPFYSAVPWRHQGRLYLFLIQGGTEYRNDNLLLACSADDGLTWSEPVTLFRGHFWNCHTGMVIQDNRLYWAVDDLSFGMYGNGSRGPCVVAGDLSRDLLRPEAWRLSNPVPFPGVPGPLWQPSRGERGGQYLEPNVIAVNGRLRVLATVKIGAQSTTGLCAVLDVDDDGQSLGLRFTQYHPMPGGQLKFCVIHDPVSKLFWATVNLAVDGQAALDFGANGNDRRFLMLMYGMDGLNWFQAGCIARADRLSRSFMYACPVVAGDDLGIISRSNIDGPDAHDADCATFHRVRNFRSLAMNLLPDKE